MWNLVDYVNYKYRLMQRTCIELGNWQLTDQAYAVSLCHRQLTISNVSAEVEY